MKSKPTLADAMQKTAEPKATTRAPSRRGKKASCPLLGTRATSKRLKILAAINETSAHSLGLEEAIDLDLRAVRKVISMISMI